MKLLLLFLLPLATSFTLLPSTSVSSEYILTFIPFNLDTLTHPPPQHLQP